MDLVSTCWITVLLVIDILLHAASATEDHPINKVLKLKVTTHAHYRMMQSDLLFVSERRC